jgi:fatty acid desaturase
MPFLVSVLGLFYVVGALLVLRQVRFEWLLDRAIGTLAESREPDRNRGYFMAAAAALYGAAGLALLLRSGIAVWLLGSGLVLQAGYYGVLWLVISPEARANDERWSNAWIAATVSTAAFAFSTYAMRSGLLT